MLHSCVVILIKCRHFGMSINSPDKLSQNASTENAESGSAFYRSNYCTFYKQKICV